MYSLIKPFLFLMSPETAHSFTTKLFKLLCALPGAALLTEKIYRFDHPSLKREVFGIEFPNPVGLAAGFDKEGDLYRSFKHLGFGFIEVGTVTPKPQPGNPRPRMFRLKDDEGLINRLGFNNGGLDATIKRLKDRPPGLIVGGNIGKNKVTPNDEAVNDYITCFEGLFEYVDYFTINVSSPNTPGLRELQGKEPLTRILNALGEHNVQKPKRKPLLLKIAPDLTDRQLDEIVEIVRGTGIDGLIATNTTLEREGLRSKSHLTEQAGGLSGKPVRRRSTEVIRYLHTKSNGEIPIIGVGGIDGPEAAIEKLEAGASLVQIYTGLIYKGPGLVKRINRRLVSD